MYFRKKYILFFLSLLACFLLISFLPGELFPFEKTGPPPMHKPHNEGSKLFFIFGHNLVFFLGMVFFSLMLQINNRWRKAEKEKLKAELSYFKAQINPHFLFNSLNTIYSLAIQKADNTPEAVVKLSGMMRYVISDASHDFVPLENEISYITDYIELQKIRFGDTVTIDYQPCDPGPVKYIAPLILIPFIENAFKFGVNPEADSLIVIMINITGPELHLHVFNIKVSIRQESETVGGLGISNARQRLALLYPDNHRLLIDDAEDKFTVDLYITLS
jgi:LytS/YehU family sensor histidine kinase